MRQREKERKKERKKEKGERKKESENEKETDDNDATWPGNKNKIIHLFSCDSSKF